MSKNITWELIAKKLSGEATNEELAMLEALLKSDPDLHYPMQTVADLWHQNTPDTEDAHLAFIAHSNRMAEMGASIEPEPLYTTTEPEPRTFRKRKYLLPAMLVVMVLCAGYYSRHLFGVASLPASVAASVAAADISEVSTRNGSRTKLQLPDGTQVWLNSGSKLSYNKTYGNSLREVFLSGEAYFDVVKNAGHPFIIHTVSIDIKVLGTAFNVKSFPNEKVTETSLIRGSIEVTFKNRPSEKIILKPNEKLVTANEPPAKDSLQGAPVAEKAKTVVHADESKQDPLVMVSHLTYVPADSTIVETSWMENKLIFRSEKFEDLAVKMERWYGVSIRFADDGIKPKKLNGIFENESVQQALKALQLVTPFTYIITKNNIVISSK